MTDKKAMEQGWTFASKITGASAAVHGGSVYAAQVIAVQSEIDNLARSLASLKSGASDSSLGGFVAESWHAGTFNINAKASWSTNVAVAGQPGTEGVLGRNNYGSIDVMVQTADGTPINEYGSKYMVNAKETAKSQATPNKNGPGTKYGDQLRLNPSDQNSDVIGISQKRASNPKTPENWKEGYEQTAKLSRNRISDGKVDSKPLSKEESMELAKEIKEDKLDLKKHGVENELAGVKEIMQKAAKAGLTAAAISAIMATAPDIFKAIDYLIKNKEIDPEQLKNIGVKGLTAGAEGFIIGSTACILQMKIAEGLLGPAIQQAMASTMAPTILGMLVSLAYTTIKNSIMVAAGKMTPREMGSVLVDTVVISSGYIAGAAIGGAIGQAIGFTLPVFGYILGSLVGCAFAAVYNIGKKKFISFCVDSGFSCFGLVDQDYTLPEAVLADMGIDITPISRTQVSRTDISWTQSQGYTNRTSLQTVDIKIVKRGIIGVNQVGYVLT